MILQRQDIDFTMLEVNVESTLQALRNLQHTEGQHFSGLQTFITEFLKDFDIPYEAEMKTTFKEKVIIMLFEKHFLS